MRDGSATRPWSAQDHHGEIPWHEPGFSERMLAEHLSQEHDRASRRLETIDRHVAWIHETVLGSAPSRILDLGCGPGLYTQRLAALGHACVGIDVSPASIRHARSRAEGDGLACEYRLEDLRKAEFGAGFDLVLLVFGELNTFPPREAGRILARARRATSPSGRLLLEVHDERHVRAIGVRPPTWFTAARSLFAEEPHLCLAERAWHADARAATEEFLVVSLRSGEVARVVSTTQAYSEDEYRAILREAGLAEIERFPSLDGGSTSRPDGLFVLVARPATLESTGLITGETVRLQATGPRRSGEEREPER